MRLQGCAVDGHKRPSGYKGASSYMEWEVISADAKAKDNALLGVVGC